MYKAISLRIPGRHLPESSRNGRLVRLYSLSSLYSLLSFLYKADYVQDFCQEYLFPDRALVIEKKLVIFLKKKVLYYLISLIS
jgi:hypothetical protein